MTIATLDLFDIPRILPKCDECGGEFEAKNRKQRFCSIKCKNRSFNRQIDAANKVKSDAGILLGDMLPKREPKGERDKQICEFLDEGWPWIAVARKIGVSKAYVRKRMIILGRWSPKAKHNGNAKKGMGQYSRKPSGDEIRRREDEKKALALARRKMIEERKARRAEERLAILNAQCREVMGALLSGESMQSFIRQKHWGFSRIYEHLSTMPEYKSFREEKAKDGVDYMEIKRLDGRLTRQFRDEYEMQDFVGRKLTAMGIRFGREYKIGRTKSRADFKVGNYAIECKCGVGSRELSTAVGQAALYKQNGLKPIILIPDDVFAAQDWIVTIESVGAKLIQLQSLKEWISTIETRPSGLRGKHAEVVHVEHNSATHCGPTPYTPLNQYS